MSLTLSPHSTLADITLTLDGQPPSEVLDTIVNTPAFTDTLHAAARAAAAQLPPATPPHHADQLLYEAGVTALDGLYADLLAAHSTRDTLSDYLKTVTTAFATNTRPLGFPQPLSDFANGPLAAIDASSKQFSLVVRLADGFRNQRRSQRVDICQLLAAFADVLPVTIVGTHLQLRWLANTHREQLPGVHEYLTTDQSASPTEETIAAATRKLSTADSKMRLLEQLHAEPSETLDYDALSAHLPLARQTIRGHVSDLSDLGLINTFGPQSDRRVELTAAGRQFIQQEIATQRRLSDSVSESRNPSDNSRVARASTGDPPSSEAASTRWLHRADHAATAAIGTPHEISLVDYPLDKWDCGRKGWAEPAISIDSTSQEVVVGVQAASSLHLVTSAALAFFGPKAREKLWTDEQLAPLESLLTDNQQVLHYIRTIGWTPDDVETTADFRNAMKQAALDLRDLTIKLGNGEYDDENDLRSEIMRTAHGILGVATQVAAITDLDVYYQFRFPEWTRNWDSDRREEIAKTITTMVAVQSQYAGHTAYRHLLETREKKRQQSFSVTVDAAEPTGQLIPAIVLVGPGMNDFEFELQREIEDREEHSDAPEFAVEVPITTEVTHREWRETLRRAAELKRLSVSERAVRTARALTGSPFDAARGIVEGLSPEGEARELRADELRLALATLPTERILPSQPPTVQETVHTLLQAGRPLPEDRLLEEIDQTRRSFKNNRDGLIALGIIEQTEGGWRICLSPDYEAAEEWPATTRELCSRLDVLYRLAMETLPPSALSGGHPVVDRLHSRGVPSLSGLPRSWGLLEQWLPIVRAVEGSDPGESGDSARLGEVTRQGWKQEPISQTSTRSEPADKERLAFAAMSTNGECRL